MVARVERAILGLGDLARVHVYRWGDGSAHFHVWFYPRPLGMLEAKREMLPLWADLLPEAPRRSSPMPSGRSPWRWRQATDMPDPPRPSLGWRGGSGWPTPS